jgi:hypothetical protein
LDENLIHKSKAINEEIEGELYFFQENRDVGRGGYL